VKRVVAQAGEYVIRVKVVPLEEGGFLATCPDLPGCRAEGRTIPEILEYIADVAEKMIGLMRAEGVSIPEAVRRHKKREALQSEILVSLPGQ
jgi:predicted RNase H-like HicB family nuclease